MIGFQLRQAAAVPLQNGTPDAGLKIDVYRAGVKGTLVGKALASITIPAKAIGWSAKRQVIHPAANITKGKAYCIVLSSATKTGSYGFTYDNGGSQNLKISAGDFITLFSRT